METRAREKRVSEVRVGKYEPFLDDLYLNGFPAKTMFKKNLNHAVVKVLKPSSRKQGPWRCGTVPISLGQYVSLREFVSHRFSAQQDLITHFEIETRRFRPTSNANIRNSVEIQLDTFEARLSRPLPVRYLRLVDNELEEQVAASSAYNLKFKFRKLELIQRV
jgi:hypothetical protein